MIVRVAIAQINSTVGDLDGNADRIVRACEQAAALGADIVVTPELSLVGYPPEDLLLRPALYARARSALATMIPRQAALEGVVEERVHHAVALDPALSLEGRRHHIQSEVSFPALPPARMAGMLV